MKLGKPFRRSRDRAWVLPFSTEPGKWRQKQMPAEVATRAQAAAWAASWASEAIASGATLDTKRRASGGPTVRDLAEKWLGLREASRRAGKLAPATVKDNRTHVTKHIVPALGSDALAALDVPRLREFVRGLGEKLSASGCRNVLSTLASFIDDAMAEGWVVVGANMAKQRKVAGELPPQKQRRAGTVPIDSVQALIDADALPLERRVRYAVAFTGGQRDGEIAGLRWSDVELDASPPRLSIRCAVSMKGPTGFASEGSTKTRESVRVVPLHPVAVAFLRAWLAHGWEMFVGRVPKIDDFVFPRRDGKAARPRSAEFIREDLEAIGKPTTTTAGEPIEFRMSRASFLTWLVEEGVDRAVRKRLVGHVESDVTEKHYTARELIALHEAVCKVPLGFVGTLPDPTKRGPLERSVPMRNSANGAEKKRNDAAEQASAHNAIEFLNRWPDVRVVSGAPRIPEEIERNADDPCGAATKFPTTDPTTNLSAHAVEAGLYAALESVEAGL